MLDKISGYIMLSWGVPRFVIAFGAGAVLNLALAPIHFFAIIFISFPILIWLLDGASGQPDKGLINRQIPAFFSGWSFGFGYFVGGLWWLANAVITGGDGAYWAVPFAIFGLPAFLAIFFGCATAFARMFWKDNISRILLLSASLGIFEFLRGHIFTGFPWNTLGYLSMPSPIAMQSVEIVGIYGMTILTVVVASTPALFATKTGLKTGLFISSILITLHVGYGLIASHFNGPETTSSHIVRIVQPSINQSEKWDTTKREEIFETYLKLTADDEAEGSERPSIIIWPETSVPYILTKTPDALAQIADTLELGQTLIVGAVRLEGDGLNPTDKYYNSIHVIDDEGQILDSADKAHLVPFGEYLPFEKFARNIGLTPLAETFGGYTAATGQKTLKLRDGTELLPLICYEAIFPAYTGDNQTTAQFIVNVTNDAWYGISPGPYQHLQQAQARSIESGLPMLRAGNNGISAVIDNRGSILSGMGLNFVGFIDHSVPPKRGTIWSEQSRIYAFLLILALIGVVILRMHLQRR
ncbi:apolipoprotein N-acyltransferase [Lentilitoribacter sp. Alg239-R112]|uniref:apolipoprotein N-acyltransferase n=1 Tax=Lentilitoribacter sp. Alg239-R112 TaxID=2305987 RepID=UPI001FCE35BD|nr:apolipoprotein N-acyltransferase [Lentilitoribacter sp. Alg239-R112]